MKFNQIILATFMLVGLSLSAQRQCQVVKFNGDTLYFDEVAAGGKTIVCKSKGQDKVKLNAIDVSYYIKPVKMYIQNEGETKAHQVDTVKKCIVSDSKIFLVQIENDSVYLAESTEIGTETGAMDYHIFRKKNNEEVLEIRKDKSALETLKKYFGGSCAVFDNQIVEFKPKFQKAVFPYEEWWTLLYTYNNNCVS